MVTVRYTEAMGRARGPSILPGDEAEVDEDTARRLVAKGLAVEAEPRRRGRKARTDE
jgi:hypothetical protein